jgi:hypothetical protein
MKAEIKTNFQLIEWRKNGRKKPKGEKKNNIPYDIADSYGPDGSTVEIIQNSFKWYIISIGNLKSHG